MSDQQKNRNTMNNFLGFLKFFVKNTKDKGPGYKI